MYGKLLKAFKRKDENEGIIGDYVDDVEYDDNDYYDGDFNDDDGYQEDESNKGQFITIYYK